MLSFLKRQLFIWIKPELRKSLLLNYFHQTFVLKKDNKLPFKMKIDTPEFKGIFSLGVQTLLDIFERNKYEIRLAGGAVRDILIGKHPKDIDFATTATPNQMKFMFVNEEIRMINFQGEKHGTITVRIDDENYEITTLRIDTSTDGRHAVVQFVTDWELDANRRDLTINSMFLGTDGTLYDYFGGHEDLQNKRVIFVGNASKRIQEDYLRILRYFRFFGRITETPDVHDENTILAIKANAQGLEKVSGERIWQELTKICAGNYVCNIIQKIIETDVGKYIGFPKAPNTDELICIYERGKHLNLHPITILVTLFQNEQEMLAFHSRCKLSGFERDLGLFLIKHRNTEHKCGENLLQPYQSLMLKTDGKVVDTRLYIIELLKYNANLTLLHEFKNWEPPKFPINGYILKQNGVPAGKPLGIVMKKLKFHWIDSNFKMTANEIIELLPKVMEDLQIKSKPTVS